jgi:hypothetical protein
MVGALWGWGVTRSLVTPGDAVPWMSEAWGLWRLCPPLVSPRVGVITMELMSPLSVGFLISIVF